MAEQRDVEFVVEGNVTLRAAVTESDSVGRSGKAFWAPKPQQPLIRKTAPPIPRKLPVTSAVGYSDAPTFSRLWAPGYFAERRSGHAIPAVTVRTRHETRG